MLLQAQLQQTSNNRFCTLGAKRKMYLGWQSSNKGSDIRVRVVPVTFPPLPRCSSIRRLLPLCRPPRPTLSRDISSANTRSRTVKGLTSQHDPFRASALALVTSKVHDVIPWKRSTSKIAAWKWPNVFIQYPVSIQLKVSHTEVELDFMIGFNNANRGTWIILISQNVTTVTEYWERLLIF